MGRRVLVVIAMVALAAIACGVRASMAARLGPDLIGNITGGHLVFSDVGHLYDRETQHAYEEAVTHSPLFLDVFISPPHTAVLFAPLAALPFRIALVVFASLSFAAFAVALALARPLAPDAPTFAMLALAFAASEPFAETIIIGQTSAFALLLWAIGIRLAMAKKDALAGAVLGLGVFKPQLFLIVPVVLLAQRRWRALGAFAASAAVLVAIGALVAGPHAYAAWVAILRSPAYGDVREANMFHMCSIEALLHGVVPTPLAIAVHAVVSVVALAALFSFARRGDEARVWAGAILVTLFATPHLIIYDAVLVIVPVLVLARDASRDRVTRLAVLATFGLAWLVPVLRVPILCVPILYLTWKTLRPPRSV